MKPRKRKRRYRGRKGKILEKELKVEESTSTYSGKKGEAVENLPTGLAW